MSDTLIIEPRTEPLPAKQQERFKKTGLSTVCYYFTELFMGAWRTTNRTIEAFESFDKLTAHMIVMGFIRLKDTTLAS